MYVSADFQLFLLSHQSARSPNNVNRHLNCAESNEVREKLKIGQNVHFLPSPVLNARKKYKLNIRLKTRKIVNIIEKEAANMSRCAMSSNLK